MMPIEVIAPITDVTVYVSHARITRRGTLRLPAGEQTILLSPITPKIEADSVRTGGRGAGITIRSVDVKTDYQVENPQVHIETLKNEIQDKLNSQSQLNDEAKSLKKRFSY